MIKRVPIQVLNAVCPGSGLHLTGSPRAIIVGIIQEPEEIKSSLVLPEILVFIPDHHHRGFTSHVGIIPVGW